MAQKQDALRWISENFGDVFHEWHGQKAAMFFQMTGISERNWRVFMRSSGLADGQKWSLRKNAEEECRLGEKISHVRVKQIIESTALRLKKFAERMSAQG